MTARAQIWTYQDVIDQLADRISKKPQKEILRSMRRAILKAHRDLPNLYRWNYFDRRYVLYTNADESHTAAYDHTGGAHERMLTTTGTWPADVQFYKVVIDNKHYSVDQRKDDTILTLRADSNPGADVASGTVTIYQDSYPLPVDFLKLHEVYDVGQERRLRQVSPDRQHAQSIHAFDTPETPWTVTVRGKSDLYNRMFLIFSPPPDASTAYDIGYQAGPRPLQVAKYETGTVSITADTTTVTGSSTVFPTTCEGSIIRFSSNSVTPPTSVVGDLDDNDNPFFAERRILVRDSATSLTLDESIDTTLSGVKYTISDPIDIDNYAIYTAFLRMVECEYLQLRDSKPEEIRLAQQAMYDAFSLAREMDQKMPDQGEMTHFDRFRKPNITQD